MNLRQIRALRLLVRTGSVTATAQMMGVSQSAISKMIKSLEVELDIQLIDHQRGRVQPRSELAALLPAIDRISEGMSDLKSLSDDIKSGGTGSIVVSCSTSIATGLVAPACAKLLAANPGIRITLLVRGGRFSIDDVAYNRADLAVEQLIAPRGTIVSSRVARGHMVCVMPRSHPLRLKRRIPLTDLTGERLIIDPPTTFNGSRLQAALEEIGAGLDLATYTDSMPAACMLVRQMQVPAVVDSIMDVAGMFPDLVVRPLSPSLDFELHAMWKEPKLRPALRLLITHIQEAART
jgi:DNA-binding transcriptional LysR family regulator